LSGLLGGTSLQKQALNPELYPKRLKAPLSLNEHPLFLLVESIGHVCEHALKYDAGDE
jgi:hypothetical protein